MMQRVVFCSVALLTAGCLHRSAGVSLPDCVDPPGALFSRALRLATSATIPNDRGELVVITAAGDSIGRRLDKVVIDIASLDAGPSVPAHDVRMRATGSFGSHSAVVAGGRVGLLVRRVGYEVHRDTVTVRAGYSDTLALRLRPMCVGF